VAVSTCAACSEQRPCTACNTPQHPSLRSCASRSSPGLWGIDAESNSCMRVIVCKRRNSQCHARVIALAAPTRSSLPRRHCAMQHSMHRLLRQVGIVARVLPAQTPAAASCRAVRYHAISAASGLQAIRTSRIDSHIVCSAAYRAAGSQTRCMLSTPVPEGQLQVSGRWGEGSTAAQ
jgi:hypothetical protein